MTKLLVNRKILILVVVILTLTAVVVYAESTVAILDIFGDPIYWGY